VPHIWQLHRQMWECARRETPCLRDLIASASVPRCGPLMGRWTWSGMTT